MVVQHLPRLCEALGSIPSITKIQSKSKKVALKLVQSSEPSVSHRLFVRVEGLSLMLMTTGWSACSC